MNKKILATALPLALMGAEPASAESTVISPKRERADVVGPARNFTGHVVVEPLFTIDQSKRALGGHVTFAPGARSAWHSHSTGQVLIVTDGVGWIQGEGGAKREIKAGDVVDAAGPEALARGHGEDRHAAYLDHLSGRSGGPGRLDGACHRRAVPEVIGRTLAFDPRPAAPVRKFSSPMQVGASDC